MQAIINGVTTTFVGNHYEVTGGTVTKYYGVYPEGNRRAGAQRVAMRTGNTVHYLFSDHLGSTSLTTDASGNRIAELRYKPWGEVRYADGATPTDYQFTGQYSHMSDFGLYFFNARWYDPASGRFNQPDTTVPDPNNPQAWDRYAYVGNNPCRYNDPDGHCWPVCTMVIGALVAGTVDAIVQYNQKGTVDLKEVAVAATVGAVGGLVGGAIIAPLAQAAGAYAFAAAGSLWAVSAETALTIGVTTELATGVALSAGTNVVLSATHRELDKSLRGGEITWNSYTDDMKRHWQNDAFIGGVSYGLSSLVSESLPRTFYPPQNTTQKILYSGMEGAGVGISNTDLMDTVIPNILDNKEESWQDYWRRYERYERYER